MPYSYMERVQQSERKRVSSFGGANPNERYVESDYRYVAPNRSSQGRRVTASQVYDRKKKKNTGLCRGDVYAKNEAYPLIWHGYIPHSRTLVDGDDGLYQAKQFVGRDVDCKLRSRCTCGVPVVISATQVRVKTKQFSGCVL